MTYKPGKSKSVYKLGKKYIAYQSHSNSPLVEPPSPPAATVIPVDSLYAHVHSHPNASAKIIQSWVYTMKSRKAGRWELIFRGATKRFGEDLYQVQWKEETGLSWVKTH